MSNNDRDFEQLAKNFITFVKTYREELARLEEPESVKVNTLSIFGVKPLKAKEIGRFNEKLEVLFEKFNANIRFLDAQGMNKREVAQALDDMSKEMQDIRAILRTYLKSAERSLSDKMLVAFLKKRVEEFDMFLKGDQSKNNAADVIQRHMQKVR